MKPTSPADRILEVDVLRGLAVLGMVIWNFRSHSMGDFRVASTADAVVNRLVALSDVQNTIHLIFAFLFGWGLAQGLRKDPSGHSVVASNTRKLVVLFLMGMANACLADRTDVLQSFAVLGAVSLLFANRSNRAVLWSAFFLVSGPVLGQLLLTAFLSPQAYAGTNLYASLNGQFILSASYGDLVVTRAREVVLSLGHPNVYIENLDVLVAFLLGLYATRRAVFGDLAGNLRLIWGVLAACLTLRALGLLWSVIPHPASYILALLVAEYAKHALAVAYICVTVLVLRTRAGRMLLRPLAPVGRLALTNYLVQGIIGTTVFFGYGFGRYEQLGMAAGEALALGVFAVLTLLSGWWVSRFAFGPAEWLWRMVTYWRLGHLAPPDPSR